MKRVFKFVAATSLVLLATCTKDQAGPDACFEEEILPIFVSNCSMAGCHNSIDRREGLDLSNYEGIMRGVEAKHPLRSEVYTAIRGNNPSMPVRPFPKLSDRQVNLIKLWINMGAKNTSNCKTCDTLNYGYNIRIKGIMETWCVSCHNSGNKGGSYDLSTYNGLVSAASTDKFLGSIKHLTGFLAMPATGGMVSACEIAAIEKWVAVGYPIN